MTSAAALYDRSTTWLRKWLVSGYGLRRAVRAAVVVPLDFAIGSQLVDNSQTATFAAFGSFALLLFVEFPGNRTARAAEFGLLAVTGAVLIVAGTYAAHPSWLAVTSMAVVAFVILFSGVVSSVTAGAGRAALLLFILPVMLPGDAVDHPGPPAGMGDRGRRLRAGRAVRVAAPGAEHAPGARRRRVQRPGRHAAAGAAPAGRGRPPGGGDAGGQGTAGRLRCVRVPPGRPQHRQPAADVAGR